jgi:hypothetical protein
MSPDESHKLRESVDSLQDEVRVLRNVLDEIREDLSWAIHNGVLPQIDRPGLAASKDTEAPSTSIPKFQGKLF